MPGMSGWKKLVRSGSYSWSPSLDGLRKKLAKGLEVRVEQPEARRGDEVRALVVISDPTQLGELEVGLVCTVHYDEEVHSGHDGGTTRTTAEAVEHEAWQPVPSLQGEHDAQFTIPPDAPFSHEGSCLSFTWQVLARGCRDRALDAKASHELSVLP